LERLQEWAVTNSFDRRRVGVLGGLGVFPVERLSGVSRRVLAYLAVKGPSVARTLVGMDLWPDLPEDRARANLRRALWQLPTGWITADGPDLVLDAEVDLTEARQVADRAFAAQPLDGGELRMLLRDLLPGWYEDWIVSEQEQFHLQRVQALEAVCRTATHDGAYRDATAAGLAAVCAEPLRESAVTALVEAHLGEGNRFEALRRYQAYESLLRCELDTAPGRELHDLVSSFALP
jgi:DNA-binding SARP family transcriptional activator